MSLKVNYKLGPSSNLDKLTKVAGSLIVTNDTGEMYLDLSANERIKITDPNKQDKFLDITSTTSETYYYNDSGNEVYVNKKSNILNFYNSLSTIDEYKLIFNEDTYFDIYHTEGTGKDLSFKINLGSSYINLVNGGLTLNASNQFIYGETWWNQCESVTFDGDVTIGTYGDGKGLNIPNGSQITFHPVYNSEESPVIVDYDFISSVNTNLKGNRIHCLPNYVFSDYSYHIDENKEYRMNYPVFAWYDSNYRGHTILSNSLQNSGEPNIDINLTTVLEEYYGRIYVSMNPENIKEGYARSIVMTVYNVAIPLLNIENAINKTIQINLDENGYFVDLIDLDEYRSNLNKFTWGTF